MDSSQLPQISPQFRNALLFALGATAAVAIIPPLRRWTLIVGGTLLVILILRYRRTKGK